MIFMRAFAKLNRAGLIFCGAYTVWFVTLTALAYLSTDPKGSFVLGAFSIFPAGILFAASMYYLGLENPPFPSDSWINSVYVAYLACLIIAYLAGWDDERDRAPSDPLRRRQASSAR